MPSIRFDFAVSPLVVLLLSIAAFLAAAYVYRQTLPPVPQGTRRFLAILRGVAISLILLFIFEPVLNISRTILQPGVLAVLIDQSKSMSIKDRAIDRLVQLRQVLSSSILPDAAADAEIRYYRFGVNAAHTREVNPDTMLLQDDATNISSALRLVGDEKEQLNIRSILILSDGNYNLGQNPRYEADRLGIPIFSIGIGDSTEQKDVRISRVLTNEIVYNDSEVPVDVTIHSSGYEGERVSVVLSDGTREMDRQQVQLGAGVREYAIRLMYVAEGEGAKKYSVRVESLPGELTAENNRRNFLVRVLKRKVEVFVLAGGPSADLTSFKQVLAEEKHFTIKSFTQRVSGSFYEGNVRSASLDSADCIVMIGFPTLVTPSSVLDNLVSVINRTSKPVMFIEGKAVDEGRLKTFASMLPFTYGDGSGAERLVFVQPNEKFAIHPVLASESDGSVNNWKKLPPIFQKTRAYRANPEATVLAFSTPGSVPSNEPIILLRNINRQKTIAVLGYGLWRWRLMAQGTAETEDSYRTFVTNSIRWLATRDDNKQVRVETQKQFYVQGEAVEFLGQVYDPTFSPVPNADVQVNVESHGRNFEVQLRSALHGRYEGKLEGLPEGDYTYRASATLSAQPLGDDQGRFTVGELNMEYQETRMNVQLLRQLAEESGGEFLPVERIEELKSIFGKREFFRAREVVKTERVELWNWRYGLLILILLLATEWFIRKRSGML